MKRPSQASGYFDKDNVFWWAAVLRATPPSEEGSLKATAILLQPVFSIGVLVPALQMRWPWRLILCQRVGKYLQTRHRFAAEREGGERCASPRVLSCHAAPVAGHPGTFQVQTQIAVIKPVIAFLPETTFLLCCVGNNRIRFAIQQ